MAHKNYWKNPEKRFGDFSLLEDRDYRKAGLFSGPPLATTLRSTQRSRQVSMGGPDARIVPRGSTPGGSTPGGSTVKSRGLSNQQNISLSPNNMSTHSDIYPPKKKIFLKDWQCPLPMTDRARGQKQARYVVEAARDLVKVDGYYLDHCKCIYFQEKMLRV